MPVRPFLNLVVLLITALSALWTGVAHAQGADPWARWHSAESLHFRVHYHDDQRAQAEAVARAAERAFARISPALRWAPKDRTDLVVFSEFDLPNGFSTPLPANLVGAFLTPPEGELIENSRWLELLLTHEMVHSIHLDKAWGGPANLRDIVGRFPLLFPNVFQPTWAQEGLAVYFEGAQDGGPAAAARFGRGRLYGPDFEPWLRARQSKGFPSLAEISANGRALPLSKAYLYGAYFYDYVARRYGAQAIPALVESYSGNWVPRFLSYTEPVTGLPMDALWAEFLRDLDQQVSARAEPLRSRPEVLGPALGAATADISGVAALPASAPTARPALIATVSDGLHDPELVRFEPDGSRRTLTALRGQSPRLEVSAGGDILVTQADLCQNTWLTLDAWRWNEREGRLDRLSRCAHLRRVAGGAGSAVLAIQLDGGRTRLVRLGASAQAPATVLYDPGAEVDLLDLAVSPDGRRVLLVLHAAPEWQLVELSLEANAATAPQLRLVSNAPFTTPRYAASGAVELLLARDGTTEVWRLNESAAPALERLTHSHTGVSTHSGSAADGSLAVVTFHADGRQLHRLEAPAPLETITLGNGRRLSLDGAGSARPPGPAVSAAATPAEAPAVAASVALGSGKPYQALSTMAPRYWWPVAIADHGLKAYGLSTAGADALRLHQYALDLEVETSQHQGLGSLEYLWSHHVHLALQRRVAALAWQVNNGQEQTLRFQRHTQAQGLVMSPSLTLSRRVVLGLGAAIDQVEDLPTPAGAQIGMFGLGPATTLRNDRVVDLLLDVDTRKAHWWSEGPNQGWRVLVLGESYDPWRDTVSGYNGHLLRADLSALFDLSSLGHSVLALRHTEVRSKGDIRPFQLGGATDPQLQLGYSLNNRQIALRGYVGTEAALRGPNARVSSVEWRFPLADVDAQGLAPPIGLNRLSASVFYDIGGVWSPAPGPTYGNGSPAQLYRGAGVELLGELRLLHALGVQLRLGLARAIDQGGGTAYLTAGRSF